MPLDLKAIEDAIHAWFSGATGLRTIWANQNVPQPARPYATLKILAIPRKGGQDEQRWSTVLGRPAGQEVEVAVIGQRRLALSCQAFSSVTTGTGTASELLAKAQSSLGLPSVLDQLEEAGLSVVNEGGIKDVSALLETDWESRAALDVEFALADVTTETTGFIETADVTGTFE